MPEYLEASMESGEYVSEEEFEWTLSKLTSNPSQGTLQFFSITRIFIIYACIDDHKLIHASTFWRIRLGNFRHGYDSAQMRGAFESWRGIYS